ncbi:MAG: hypothetical protein OEP95_05235, partial [Myxococcales bacterium]|nr:hypothetical protein [Myxococcales bacterium]
MTRSTPPLEQRARASLARQGDEEADERLSVPELRHALHELHVHQIELELQNEELRTTQHQLEESRAALATSEYRYHELFERAPVGYLRVGRNGAILEVNDTGVELLR